MVPVSVVGGAIAVAKLFDVVSSGTVDLATALAAGLTSALTAAFYSLIVWAYLRRGQARSTTTSRRALLAAPLATFLPFAMPFLGRGGVDPVVLLMGDWLLVCGFAFSVWAVRHLDRSLSVVAQAREVVDSGPYAAVRHPLYVGEIVAMLGLALTLGGVAPLMVWGVLVLLQAFRAVHEEALLAAALPAYAGYRRRTARLLPGVF